MKKFYLGALGCMLAMGAGAQKVEQVGTMQGEVWSLQSIPTEYAYDGKSSLYTINETETDVEFIVYNKSFAVDRTFKVANPASYVRTVVESREAVMTPDLEGRFDCGYKTLKEFYDGGSYLYETKSYPHWWAVNKCTNTTYTDEYVVEYFEDYSQFVEQEEYNGGTLFVFNNYYGSYNYYYFKDNKLYYAYPNQEPGEDFIYVEEVEEYYNFYNTQLAVFSQEDIAEYINQGQWLVIQTEGGRIHFDNYEVASIKSEADGSVVFLTNTFSETTGLKFIWDKDFSTLTAVGGTYKKAYIGEWVKEEKEDEYYEEEPSDWIWYDAAIFPFFVGQVLGELDDESGIKATQTLFNNDEKWEILRPLYAEGINSYDTSEKDRDGDGEIDYKQTRYTDKLEAYEVISEDGNVLSTITVPEGDWCCPMLVRWDGETYFGINVETEIEEDGDYYYEEFINIYSIDKNATNVKKIASTPAMRVSPAVANRNSTVNVTLDAETVKNGGELIITDSNGRTVGWSRVEVGQSNVPVTTDRMDSGVYNITLTEKGQKVENARIIVK